MDVNAAIETLAQSTGRSREDAAKMILEWMKIPEGKMYIRGLTDGIRMCKDELERRAGT